MKPTKVKLGTRLDNGWMYRVYRNQAAAAYLSHCFFFFLSIQFSNINKFRHIFLRNCVAYQVETCYTHRQTIAVSCIPNHDTTA